MGLYRIADITLYIENSLSDIPESFAAFQTEETAAYQINWARREKSIHLSSDKPCIYKNSYIEVYDYTDSFLLLYPMSYFQLQILVKCDGTSASYYIGMIPNHMKSEMILYGMRDAFFIYAIQHNYLALHCSSIIYQDRALLFSGCSGTGKTTHTKMWQEEYHVSILNGDVCLIKVINGISVAYGLPWCGSSKQFVNAAYSLGGIVFLEQSNHNQIVLLSPIDGIMNLSARAMTPNYNTQMVDIGLAICQQIYSTTKCIKLYNKPEIEAVNLVKEYFTN